MGTKGAPDVDVSYYDLLNCYSTLLFCRRFRGGGVLLDPRYFGLSGMASSVRWAQARASSTVYV